MRHKFLLFLIITLCSSQAAIAKSLRVTDVSFGMGFRSHFSGLQSLNNIIKQYNAARPWLDNKLNLHGTQNGFEFGLEFSDEKFGLSALKYFRVWKTTTAKGSNNGQDFTRKVSSRVVGMEIIDFWYTPISIKSLNFGGGIMPMGLGVFRVKSKLNEEDWKRAPLSDLENTGESSIWNTFHAFSNFHLDITKETGRGSMHLQLFYSTNWFRDEYNLIYLNKELNPSTFSSYNLRQKHNQNQMGIKLIFTL